MNYIHGFEDVEDYPIISIVQDLENVTDQINPYGNTRELSLNIIVYSKYTRGSTDWEISDNLTHKIENILGKFSHTDFNLIYNGMTFDASNTISNSMCEITVLNYKAKYMALPNITNEFDEIIKPEMKLEKKESDL